MFNFFKSWLLARRMYATLDPSDNSVTLGKKLFRHIQLNAQSAKPRVLVFRIGSSYAFSVDPDVPEGTAMCDIQTNDKFRCIGFETLRPSVGRIFQDYGLPAEGEQRMRVVLRMVHGMRVYVIKRP